MPYKDAEKNKICIRLWKSRNREKVRAYARKSAYRFYDPIKARERSRKYKVKHLDHYYKANQAIKQRVVKLYGGACFCCGEKHIEFLTLEHLNHDGVEDRKRLGNDYYKKLLITPWRADLGVLCMNCNWVSRHGRACPHNYAS